MYIRVDEIEDDRNKGEASPGETRRTAGGVGRGSAGKERNREREGDEEEEEEERDLWSEEELK